MRHLARLADHPNAYRLAFDDACLNELRTLYEGEVREYLDLPQNAELLTSGKYVEARWQHGSHNYFACSYDTAPLLWVSTNDIGTHDVFDRFFRSLDVADDVKEIVDVDRKVIVYNGFFVIDDHSPATKWHVDYFDGANGLTLITPLFDLIGAQGNLLYRDPESITRKYRYRRGEAIVLGDRFVHSTEPYQKTTSRRVLVSLTFGTDKLDYWPILKATVGMQSEFMLLPCGHQKDTCACLRDFEARRKRDRTRWIATAIDSPSGKRVVPSPRIRCEEVEGETVLFDSSGRKCAGLDAVGAHMWRLLGRHGRLDLVRAAMLAEYEVEGGQLDRDLLEFVGSLADAGLILLDPAGAENA